MQLRPNRDKQGHLLRHLWVGIGGNGYASLYPEYAIYWHDETKLSHVKHKYNRFLRSVDDERAVNDFSTPWITSHPTCAEHRAAGEGPFYPGDWEYDEHVDADGDGEVCE